MRAIPVTHNGVHYPSISALAKEHGVSPNSIHSRRYKGIPAEYALSGMKGRTLSKINTRGEWLVMLGWSVEGLCTSAKWEQWGKVLARLYLTHSTVAIGDLVGVAPGVIQKDLKCFGIEMRSKGGANHRTIEYRRREQRAALNEMREMQMARRNRVPEQNRAGL